MRELIRRLGALDEDASAGLRAIEVFDSMLDRKVGLESLVRAAATLTGCAAGAVDPERHVGVRIGAEGLPSMVPNALEPSWPVAPLGRRGHVWIERAEGPVGADAVILERLAASCRITIERTRGTGTHDGAAVEVLLDPRSTPDDTRRAAQLLGLDLSERARVVARFASGEELSGAASLRSTTMRTPTADIVATIVAASATRIDDGRAGIGPLERIEHLHRSWPLARDALRLTGPTWPILEASELGALLATVHAADALGEPPPDVLALDAREAASPGSLAWLEVYALGDSLRATAERLGVHHSTLQQRLAAVEAPLGFDARTAIGKTRLSMALALRRVFANRHPAT